MKKIYLLLLTCFLGSITHGQTIDTIYAIATGFADNSRGAIINDSVVSSPIGQRAYGVFDLSIIPAGSSINYVKMGFNIDTILSGGFPPSGWNIYGIDSDLSLATSEPVLYADLVTGSSLYTATWGTVSGNVLLASTAASVTFVSTYIGNKVSMSYTSGGGVAYVMTGASGTHTGTGFHAPYIIVSYCQPAISGPNSVCPGGTITLSDASSGGTWISSNVGAATIGSTTGVVTGVASGTTNISYVIGSCTTIKTISVTAMPAILPSSSVNICLVGGSATLSDASSGGTWTSGSTSVATVGSSSGVITPVGDGTARITYTLGSCSVNKDVIIRGPGPITPASGTICIGGTILLSDTSTTGAWSASNVHASVSGGLVTGNTAGIDTIHFSAVSCQVNSIVTVNAAPTSISGSSSVCVGSSISLSDAISGGTWSITNGHATISGIGVVTGVSSGIDTVIYSIGTCSVATPITVNGPAAISPGIATVCSGGTVTLTDATPGGVWSTINASIATVVGGVVTGGSTTGLDTIYYTLSGCSQFALITVNTGGSPILGSSTVCTGSTITLSDATGGGTWSSSTVSHATVGGGTGVVTGVAAGTTTITYTIGSCFVTKIVTVNASPSTISPSSLTLCISSTSTMSDVTSGGTWTSSTPGIATVGATTGTVNALTVGTTTISYTVASCSATAPVTVVAGPAAISGSTHVCTGSTITLSDASGGGTWSSSTPGTATVGIATGVVTGITPGTVNISYTVGSCSTTTTITVNASPAAVSPSSLTVCIGTASTLSDLTSGGTWTSSTPGVATVGVFTGSVTGVTAGAATISYTVGSCSSTSAVTVVAGPSAILGSTSVCTGSTITLSDASGGGTWTSSTPAVATIGAASGIVTGVGAGTTIITYTAGSCYAVTTVTVNATPSALSSASLTICTGTSSTLTDATSGGTWTSSAPLVATVAGGVVNGLTAGSAIILYTVGGCSVSSAITVINSPTAIMPSGSVSVCSGSTVTLSDASAGGTWSSGSTGIATVGAGTGIVTGVSAGSATISYTVGTCSATQVVVVNPSPSAISPAVATVCTGTNITLTDAFSGGIWTTSAPGVATVSAGVVSGISVGSATIFYTLGTCSVSAAITVAASPAAISPSTATICVGGTAALGDATAGGTWTSSSSTIASVAGGVVTGVASGMATISYTVGSCYSTAAVTVSPTPTTITPAAPVVCVSGFTLLSETVGGGTWTSTASGIASVASTGMVTGVTVGTATISYAIGSCATSVTVTVNPLPVAGTITGYNRLCGLGSTILADGAPGGVWSTLNGNATVAGGVVTGVSTGADIIFYSVTNSCGTATASDSVYIDAAPDAGFISGPDTICAGSFTILTDLSAGGVWSISNANATITSTGIASGITTGFDTVAYTVTNSCGTASTTKSVFIKPLPNPGVITGLSEVCVGSSIALTDPVMGGVWGRTTTHASVSTSGIVTGLSAGADTIVYGLTNSCGTIYAIQPITVNPLPAAGTITGSSSVCVGSLITLTDATVGGVWSSSNTNATVTTSGVVTGVTYGIDTIQYTYTNVCGTASTIKIITVNGLPGSGSLSGPSSVCVGSAITLIETFPGGVWTATNTTASVTGLGVVHGLVAGTDTINYTVINACGTGIISYPVVVNPLPNAGTILGSSIICVGSLITLSDMASGGTWSASNANATISSTGMVIGVTTGTDLISYSVTNMCGTAIAAKLLTIDPFPVAGVISGDSDVCVGATLALTESLTGGVWSSGSALATISSTGVVTGVTAGTDTISYTITGVCGVVGTFKSITVNPLADAGTIMGMDSVCLGSSTILTETVMGGVWSAGNTRATVSTTGLVTGVTAGADPISYTVTNGCGPVSTVITEQVVTFPSAGTITGIATVCEGATTTLTDAAPGGTWLTSNANATVTSTGGVTGVTAGIDSIFYSVSNVCGTAVANKIVTINPSPVVPAIVGATNLCLGSTTTLVDGLAGGHWSSSSSAVATIGSGSGLVTGLHSGITTITYAVNNAFGCSTSVTQLDTVNAIPTAMPITGTMHVCVNGATTLTDAVPFGTWSSTSANVSVAGNVITGVSAGTATITYLVSNTCGSVTDTAVVTVNGLPVVSPISGTAATLCAGSSLALSDATSGGVWSSSNTAIATVTASTGIVTGVAAGTDTITYTVTNINGCSDYATNVLTFGGLLTASMAPGTTATICAAHSSVGLTVTAVGSGLTYQWLVGGSIIAGAVTNSYTADSAGIYSVDVSNGTCTEVLTTTVVNMTAPVISFTSPNILSTGSYAHYQWYRSGVAIPGATSSIYHESVPGYYTVVVTDGSCTDTSSAYLIHSSGGGGTGGGTGFTNVYTNYNIRIYPNPATSALHIDAPEAVNVKIISPDGKLVKEQAQTLDVNVSSLANGMYIIMLYDKDDVLIKTDRFMKLG